MTEVLLWATLVGIAVSAAAVILLLTRVSKSFQGVAREVRDELRIGREEARTASKDLREEVSTNLLSTSDALSKTLERMGHVQQSQVEAMTKELRALGDSNQEALDRIRSTFDVRVKEIQESSEKRTEIMRKEAVDGLKSTSDTVSRILETMSSTQQTQLEAMTKELKALDDSNQKALDGIRTTLDVRVKELQEGNEKRVDVMRKEAADGLKSTSDTVSRILETMGTTQHTQLEAMTRELKVIAESSHTALDNIRGTLDSRVKELQESNERRIDAMRKEASDALKSTDEKLSKSLETMSNAQQIQLEVMTKELNALTASNQDSLDRIRGTVDARVKELQDGNERKLDEMRKTVDEKLHDSLEKRLGESFSLVSERLEAVHKGLGEMQHLATGVGDLRRVLTNVKARGTWAEVQLGAILEQVLTPEQYQKNAQVKDDSGERVEYAIRLPGPRDDHGACVWLPIDSKFPQEDYLRLQEAADRGDQDAVQTALEDLARTVRIAAKDINDKYVNPPNTTDFAIMFLATEGLYAEVLRQPALVEQLQQRYRVVVAGPTTLAAILNSLRMGFQTLAIEQRAAEVWKVLGAVKTEFGKFGGVMDKVRQQLNRASRTIEQTGVRSRAMERKLRSVEKLPAAEASAILALPVLADTTESQGADAQVSPDAIPD